MHRLSLKIPQVEGSWCWKPVRGRRRAHTSCPELHQLQRYLGTQVTRQSYSRESTEKLDFFICNSGVDWAHLENFTDRRVLPARRRQRKPTTTALNYKTENVVSRTQHPYSQREGTEKLDFVICSSGFDWTHLENFTDRRVLPVRSE
jgi:hypothetical protein